MLAQRYQIAVLLGLVGLFELLFAIASRCVLSVGE